MRLLLVEDDRAIGQGIKVALNTEGYTLDWIEDGLSALHALRSERFDLVLLDLGLPRLDGFDLLRQLRAEQQSLPVLILTARDGTHDRIAGLDAGADDYLIKPFDVNELKARVRALLRRSQGRAQPLLEHAGISLDPASQQVSFQGNEVSMTPMEYQLLHQLMIRPGKVVTRERLSTTLYGWQDKVESNTLEVLIHNLRKKLSTDLIRTVRGVGYLLELKA
ncbi:Response regulator receiver:transcriptional regulatory protein [Pseudomonas cichorii]|uniref:Response regulator receiver:transcriptional regulatory protein n=1 Tax=Pseudomonas cichorii TaxID=36746 RepID=A0A3M4M0J7_PSECI|nr:response regulator [Pseudomonas cichorii]RMQ47215.1 Response regulator receiver:transcriptional regulatory protein [Pseudomonas cichorii]